MRKLVLIGLAATAAGCAATKKVTCGDEVVYVQRDCESTYATEVETSTRDISAAIDGLKGAISVGIGGRFEEQITQLSEQYDQLTVLYLKQMVALCQARQNDPCNISAQQILDLQLALTRQFSDAQLGIVTATETISGAMADDDTAAAAVEESLQEVEALLEEARQLLAAAE